MCTQYTIISLILKHLACNWRGGDIFVLSAYAPFSFVWCQLRLITRKIIFLKRTPYNWGEREREKRDSGFVISNGR